VAGGACGSACESHLYLQRQLRETLGREKDRLDRVWLISDDAPVPAHLRPALAQATVLRVPEAVLRGWLQPAPGHALQDHLYVVDPQGHCTGFDDVFTRIDKCRKHYAANGLGAGYVDQFIR
jgi:hypothetical protein